MGERARAKEQRRAVGTLRQAYIRRYGALDAQYQTWRTRQMEVMTVMQPYRGRFNVTEANLGQRKDQAIINDTGVDAQLKLASAMSTGITSPVRDWQHMKPANTDLAEDDEVKDYCHQWQDVIAGVCARSNFYNVLFQVYQDLCGPGTAAAFVEPDAETVIRLTHFPVGSYRVACDARGQVSTIMRLLVMTVGQIVEKFCTDAEGNVDLSNVSIRVADAWRNDRVDTFIDVLHVIEPREHRDHEALGAKNMPWASVWMEWGGRTATPGNTEDQLTFSSSDQILFESGFEEKPFVCGRWDVTGEDAYGQNSPGQMSVGDTKSLQILEGTSAGILATIAKPPMNVPSALANASLVPGARNPLPGNTNAKFEPSYVPHPDSIKETRAEKERFEFRIRRANFGDLLQLISNDARSTPATAEEIRGRKEERLLQLGGVFQRFGQEVLTPFINRIFGICQRAKKGPPPPTALLHEHLKSGRSVLIEYENIFAQAQKAVGVSNLDATASFAIELAKGGRPDALDLLNVDEMQRIRADMLGQKPQLLNDAKTVQAMRDQRAKAAQAQQQGQAMATAAPAVQKLSQANPANLRDLLNQFGPAAVAEGAGNGALAA